MTEITENRKRLPVAVERFVLHWGDLGGRWGVNRSVSQIHALLYLSDRPLTAEDIADLLGLARSNVSNSIKELLAWNLIRRVPIKGDRRDHFEAETDIWEMFMRISAGLKAMLDFVETLDRWYAQMLTVPKQKLAGLIRLGTRIVSFLPGGKSK